MTGNDTVLVFKKAVKAFLSLRLLVTPLVRELMFVTGMWQPKAEAEDKAVDDFVKVLRGQGEAMPDKGPNILLEGHLAEYGPNYLFRTGLAAKAIQSSAGGGDIDIVVNGFSYQWQTAVKAYRPFGISNWIFLGRKFLLLSPVLFLFAHLRTAWSFLRMEYPCQLLNIHMGGIKAGDLIYDEVLRTTRQPTVRTLNLDAYKVIARSWYYYFQYSCLFSWKRYRYYIATHTAYPEYGLLCRVALREKVTVIETSDIQMSAYDSIGEYDLPTYHQGIHAQIVSELSTNTRSVAERESRARESLRQRLESEIKQMDAQKAYSGRIYQRSELTDALGIEPQQRIGFVLAHVFCDSPHLSSSMLHADYYRWLEDTIDCCADATGITWVVKPHPSAALYGEQGMVEAMVTTRNAANVRVCPGDLNTSSLRYCADVVLTVHGTAGLEYSCLGIPAILAGTPFYAGFGFTHEPQTADEYSAAIKSAAALGRLTEVQLSKALLTFETWERQFDWHNKIVTPEVQAYVWGNGVKRDLTRAYELITTNLREHNPKELKLWHFASSVASGARARD